MDHEPEELSRERAVSSEPYSTRPNPFDNHDHSSRKRQRISRGVSRSRSVDTARDSNTVPDPMPSREGGTKAEADPVPPRTPTRVTPGQPPAEPTSSRVTINLRTARPLESIPSSPPSPATPSKMVITGQDEEPRTSVESESDTLSTLPAVETSSSSPSAVGSPNIELVAMNDSDSDFANRSPPVAIIDEDEIFVDPMAEFPYNGTSETLAGTVRRLAHFLEYDPVDNDDSFCKLRDWIDSYLRFTSDHSGSWYESYTRYRDFWLAFPDIVWALNSRSRFFGPFMTRSREGRQALSDFLSQFARLVGRFVAMDVKILAHHSQQGDNDPEPDLASRNYLLAYSFLLRKEEQSHIGRNLETHYRWNWDDDIHKLTTSFQTSGGTLSALTKLVQGQLPLIPRNPKIIETLTEPCRIAARTVIEAAAILDDRDAYHQQYLDTAQQQVTQGYYFYKTMAAGLETIIEKHITSLTPDSALSHVTGLTNILRNTLIFENSSTRELLETQRRQYPDLPRRLFPKVISTEWRFTILKRLITTGQMQLRVVGVTTMCQDLLSLYNGCRGDVAQNPLLLHFADFVLQNKLVDYIVGIGSHPEIINESNNIVGFLIVTKTYRTQQTDTIWQTVMTSQDPRVVEAILRMVGKILNLYDYQALLYICKKASDLPLEAFTVAMRECCERLFKELVSKAAMEGVQHVDAPPYDLCVRLIRESSITSAESPVGYPDIQNFAALRLRDLLVHGPGAEVRNNIYVSCIDDISARTPTAPGSICAITALLRQNMATDLHLLTTRHGLTQLIIEELEFTIAGDRGPSNIFISTSPASQARRELLLSIILTEPSTISPELGARLWNLLVGNESRNATDRSTAWQILNSAAKRASSDNVFISACFSKHLPELPPECFTIGSLDFAREAIVSWLNEAHHTLVEGDQVFESQALEQLWHMVLTAPPNTIDAPAINVLVEVYVESQLILSMPRTKARSVHLALVDRCLKQLATAANKLKAFGDSATTGDGESMVLVPTESQYHQQELIFARSLAVLREFLRAYQAKPQFTTPKSRSVMIGAPNTIEGEPVDVKYQSFDGDKHTEVKILKLGKLNTAATLFASLQKATGFKHYKVFYSGREFDPDEVEVCKSLDDLKLQNGLVLVQRREDTDMPLGQSKGNNSTLELEIMKRFDDLWDYLGMQEKVAQEIYYFLVKFPVYDRLLNAFDSESTSYSEIFPLGQPFKCLYAIYALREYITIQSQKGAVDEAALVRAIALLVAAISSRDVLDYCASQDLRDWLALHLIDCLVQFLKEPVLPNGVAPLLNDALLERLLYLLYGAKSSVTSQNSLHLTWRSFEAILEASVHNPSLWTSFMSQSGTNRLLQDLLLDDPRAVLRKSVAKQITNKCTFGQSLARVSPTDFTVAFWPIIATLIPRAVTKPHHCEETLSLGLTLFKKLAETSLEYLNLEDFVQQWGSLLLLHDCREHVGHPENIDIIAQGLTNLLYCAASFAKASQQALSCSTIAAGLFRKHLFPELSAEDDDDVIVQRLPLLDTLTRHTISETIFFLVKDDKAQYKIILDLLSELVAYDQGEDGPYVHELTYQFERSKSIRSSTGYVGLRNLSNTCYLNSLFTQLFMNVSFREFMLTAPIADGGASQKLLAETQKLFGYMQNSLRRYVDPASLAASIRTYEDTNIDVSIQMDVDEFYNLLFDRWESQMLAPEAKRRFRSFYGGQLVQQVKSKECAHISERLEPFSAIQCDIKGKSSLQESLQAYVDGEIMEGDNKYKCSTCDRHVDAVKRASLKDIPDNLIFHLKRFDFNLRTLQRSKINDYFSFPTKIDMRPYNVQHLMASPEESLEDEFELVGILVHSGTAESGHYYSFIRERPSNSDKDNWIEFNDDSVSPWDPNCMEASCYGGVDYRGPIDSGTLQYDKSFSAYMLFYQRSSVLRAQKHALEQSDMLSPIRLEIVPQLSNHIAAENELLMRKFCLYDPSHAPFVTKMLSNIRQINKGRCSEDHGLEKLVLTVSLNHLDQVIARTKDLPDLPTFMLAMRQICQSCAECCRDFLEWFCDCPETLRHLLLRNPEGLVRNEMASAILLALDKVKTDASYAYGLNDENDSADESENEDDNPRLIQRVVRTINKLWDIFHSNCRAWPEYFGLLASIAMLGDREAVVLLDSGFLRKTLEIVSADSLLPSTPQYTRMLNIISKRTATRPVSFESVIALLNRLLQACDPSVDHIIDDEERLDLSPTGETVPLTITERHLLMQHWTRTQAHILVEKLLGIYQNGPATQSILIMLLHWPESLDHYIYQAIRYGIRKGASLPPCAPFLRAALTYCEHSESTNGIARIIEHTAGIARHLDNPEGKEYLQFFKDAFEISSNHHGTSREDIFLFCLQQLPIWVPGLLTYYDAIVRTDTEDFVQEIIFRHGPDADFGSSPDGVKKTEAVLTAARKLGIACLSYLHDTYVRQRQQAVRATLLSIQTVIEACAGYYDEESDEEADSRFRDMRSSVLPALKKFTVEEADEEVSDWDGSDGDYGSSEPMDGIAELCGPAGNDLNEPDVQL